MKIIATTKNGWILEATKDEVALMMGYRTAYEDEFKNAKVTIDTEMQLGRLAATSEFLRNIDKDRLKEFKNRMEYIMVDIDKAIDTVQQLTIFEKIKDAEKK